MRSDHRRPIALTQLDSRPVAQHLNAMRPAIDRATDYAVHTLLADLPTDDVSHLVHSDLRQFEAMVNEAIVAALEFAHYGIAEAEVRKPGGHGFAEMHLPENFGDYKKRLSDTSYLRRELQLIDGLGPEAIKAVEHFYSTVVAPGFETAMAEQVSAAARAASTHRGLR